MPRKAKTVDGSTGGGNRSGSSHKKTLVKDTLLPDTQKGEAPQVEQTIEDTNALNEKVDQALIGYAHFDILTNKSKLRFGDWNTRPLVPSQVKMLLNSFLVDAQLDEWKREEVSVLSEDADTISEDVIDDLNKRIKPNVKTLEGVLACGGQWLVVLYDKRRAYCAQMDNLTNIVQKHRPSICTGEFTWIRGYILGDARTPVSHRKPTTCTSGTRLHLHMSCSTPEIYKISKQLGLHISRNEMKHVYMESPMEGLIQIFRAHCAADKTFKDITTVAHAKGTPAKQRELLKLDYVWDVMSYFDSAGTHFWHSDIMKFGDFYNTMLSSYGGILAYVVRKSESRLHYCFNTLPLDDTDVDALLMSIESDPNDAASTTVLRVVSAITGGIRSIVDECFIMFFSDTQASNNFANPTSEEWATAFAQYSNTLPIKFKELVDGLTSRGDLGVDVSDVAVALKTCSLKVIESALLEFALWWLPFIYWASVFPREWSPGSATADMFCAIMAHSSYIPQRHSNVCDQIATIVFEQYPLFLNLTMSLRKITVPPRITKQTDLLASFSLGPTSATKSRAPSKLKDDEDDNEWGKCKFIPDDDDDDDGDLNPSENISDKQEDPSDGTPDSCEERALCREREREERERCFPSLQKEVQDAISILTSSAHGKPLPPLDFYSPTTRVSCLSSNVPPNSFRGQSLLQWHTWEWASISGPSQIRNLRILACASIAEHCIIMHYHKSFLSDPASSASALRRLVDESTSKFRVCINVCPQQQTTLANDLTVTKRNINLMWPNNIAAAPSTGNCAKPFVLSKEMLCFKFESLLATQSQQLQRVMNIVESQHISWKDTTNTTILRDRPPITNDVHTCLVTLIKALDLNACVQRRAAHPCDPIGNLTDLDKQTIPVVFCNSTNPSGKNASSSLAFTILSREEVEEQESSKMVIDADDATHLIPLDPDPKVPLNPKVAMPDDQITDDAPTEKSTSGMKSKSTRDDEEIADVGVGIESLEVREMDDKASIMSVKESVQEMVKAKDTSHHKKLAVIGPGFPGTRSKSKSKATAPLPTPQSSQVSKPTKRQATGSLSSIGSQASPERYRIQKHSRQGSPTELKVVNSGGSSAESDGSAGLIT
ncbi:hypothetical protein EDC04DRAFT_2612935 [Pisolithus marmoratus]|nr:hypothetical protein EDC04DRAFT_2612935 [Pisolithus marmoratus]